MSCPRIIFIFKMETDRASNDDVSVAFEWQGGIFIVQHLF